MTDRTLARLAARVVQTCRRWARVCSAPAPASCSITRHLRLPWTGGRASLARAAGVDRIDPGSNPLSLPTCYAPALLMRDELGLDELSIAAGSRTIVVQREGSEVAAAFGG